MNNKPDDGSRWPATKEQWEAIQLAEPIKALLSGLKPLAPLAAQLLWIAQPTFALLGRYDEIAALAELLQEPDAFEASLQSKGR